MTTALFLLDPGRLDGVTPGATVVLDGPEGRHAGVVRRFAAGERLDVADGEGVLARCEVTAVEGPRVDLRVLEVHEVPEPRPRFVLVQALAKGDRDELAVETATELGVDEVVPWQAERSVVVWRGDRGERSRVKWQQVARAAAKQSRRARVPVVAPLASGADVVRRLSSAACGLVLHEEASLPLAAKVPPSAGEVVLVVGPEGGVSPRELEAFLGAGARAVRLGDTVLRSSTAGPAAIAVLSAAHRWA